MPDKEQWSADEAFWNEGWADMENRLDRKKRRGLILPLFLGLLLLAVVGAGALVLGNSPEVESTGSATVAARETTAPTAPALSDRTTLNEVPESNRETEPAPTLQVADAETASTPNASLSSPAPAAPPVEGSATESTPPIRSSAPKPERTEGRRTGSIALLEIEDLAIDFDLPEVSLVADIDPIEPADPNPCYTLLAGSSVYPSSYLPGAYAEVARRYDFGEWFVPVGLRYDYGRFSFDPVEQEPVYQSVPTVGLGSSNSGQVVDQWEQPLTAHTLSLRSGAGWSRGRITLSGGGEVAYLLGGRGPVFSIVDSAGTVRVVVEQERFNNSYAGNAADFANVGGQGAPPPSTNLNRLLFNAWVRTDLRVSGNFHLSLGLTRGLTPFYRDDALRVEATRLELGVLYSIR